MKITVLLTACDESAPFEILTIHCRTMAGAKAAIAKRFAGAAVEDRRKLPRPSSQREAMRKAWREKREDIIAAQQAGRARKAQERSAAA